MSQFQKTLGAAIGGLLLAACTSTSKIAGDNVYHGHGAETVDTKLVERFAPPPLDPGVTRFVQNLMEATAPGLGLLSPDGKTMYFTWVTTGTAQVWKSDGPMRFPVQMTSGADPTMISMITQDGKYLVLSRDHAGQEDPGLYLQPTAGGPLIEVQGKKGVRTFAVWVSNDSRTLFYMANDIKPDSYALYSYDIETGRRELLFSEPGLWHVIDVRDDQTFLLEKATGSRTGEFYEWSLYDRKLVPIIGQNEKEEYQVAFAPTNHQYFVLTNKFGEFRRLYFLSGGQLKPITPDVKREIDGFDIDHRRFRLYVQWNEDGFSKLEIRDPHTLEVIPTPKPIAEIKDADTLYVGQISRLGRYAMLGAESGLAPRTSYVFDWKDGSLTQWVRPSLPELDASQFVRAHLETYPARDGTKIPMLVSRPKRCAADPCPVIVNFHGGPEGQSRPGFNRYAQMFVSAGFIFVEPNVRGSDGYGKSYAAADDGPKRLNVITDIEDASIYIRRAWAKNGVAPKVGVMGGSYGGYSTLMAMTRFAGAYDAGVAIVGMSNLGSFLLNTAPYRRALRVSEYGDPERDKDALEKLSPTTYLSQVRDPLMIIQGVSDPRVPVGEALQMHELLEKRGVKSPLILFADEGHGAGKRDNRVLEAGHALLFFQQHLLKNVSL